jgi:hypothetical protein
MVSKAMRMQLAPSQMMTRAMSLGSQCAAAGVMQSRPMMQSRALRSRALQQALATGRPSHSRHQQHSHSNKKAGAEGPEQKQHLSLLLLYNAEGLGRVAALNNQQLKALERQEQQQGRELPLTWMLHLDPHAAHPWPCCDRGRNSSVPCSLDVSGEAGGGWCWPRQACWLPGRALL